MNVYEAECYREGEFYVVVLPQFDGVTQALDVDEVDLMARDWIACKLDIDINDVAVNITYRAPRPDELT